MRRGSIALTAAVAAALALAPGASAATVKAGAAAVDASWHVGASAGLYASDGTGAFGVHGTDPTVHSYRRAASYGIQSRLTARAIVVRGSNGKRVAIVKNDLYIPQDLLYRRTAQILEASGKSGIGRANLTMAVSHNHSSPYYSSTAWGAWTFQDVFDVRFYEYYAQQMAKAVERAAANLKPVRVGASVSYFDKTHRNSFGGQVADDGTPAGYFQSDTDHDMTVIRFDDISDPKRPKPLANLVNFAQHPESLEGNDLISADYLGPLERMVDRRTKAITIFTQSATGTAELERSSYHSVHERLEFNHKEYAQADYEGSLMARSIVDTWRDIERRTPGYPSRFVPFKSSFNVAMEDRWFPGPLSHPYPGVSSCRTDPGIGGNPRVPVVGLPDCVGTFQGPHALADLAGFPDPPTPESPPIDPGLSTDDFQRAGIPVPENYSAPSYGALQEDVSIHLQAMKLGDILITGCSCEQWSDQSRNIESRTNRRQNDQYLGYDWTERCTRRGDGKWNCPDPSSQGYLQKITRMLPPIDDHKIRRMRAQVRNDANGWNDPSYLPYAESEPVDTTKIKGNYTHQELPASQSYRLTVPIGMVNDYNGYIATYREYQRGDHYRKALTAWGPHSSDYMATRLVQMGGHLNGGPDLPSEPGEQKVPADLALNDQKARTLGTTGGALIRSYEAALPDDGGKTEATKQPRNITRFQATTFAWNGGSNFTDNPDVRVQRFVASKKKRRSAKKSGRARRAASGRWVPFADQSGEIPVTLKFPQGQEVASYLSGGQKWIWTAHFEAFASHFDTSVSQRATPGGIYRFAVRGKRRRGGKIRDYTLYSKKFTVTRWRGIEVQDIRVSKSGTVSYRVGPRHNFEVEKAEVREGDKTRELPAMKVEVGPVDYPDTYKSSVRFIDFERSAVRDPEDPANPAKVEWYCFTCTFRPWADAGNAVKGYVTVATPAGRVLRRVRAKERKGRWYAKRAACKGEVAFVRAGAVRDRFANVNGATSRRVEGRGSGCVKKAQRRSQTRRRTRFQAPRFTG